MACGAMSLGLTCSCAHRPNRYRLCWCGGNSDCISPSDHLVDIGSFLLIGPEMSVDRTCVAGQTCLVKSLQLESPSDSDHIIVLNTCGSSDLVEGWPLEAAMTTASGTVAQWDVVQAEGGQYRLCWCRGTCNSVESFIADLGRVSLLGPAPLQYAATCISGRPCTFRGVVGEGLRVNDSIQLLSTCGTTSVPNGVPLAGQTVSVETGTVSWGSLPISGPGGRYKLCWCSADFPCARPEDFRLEMGSLDLLGPWPLDQDRTCISGSTCFSPELTGYHIGDSLIALLSSCGNEFAQSVVESISTAQWNRSVMTAPGGQYRVCWCMPEVGMGQKPKAPNPQRLTSLVI